MFVNNATFGTAVAGEADITTASKQSKSKKMTDFFGGGAPSKKVDKGAEEAPVAQLKGRVLRTELDLHGTKHSGEGRTIMLELDSFYLVACYVPNSGQNLERLDYRVDEWLVYCNSHSDHCSFWSIFQGA